MTVREKNIEKVVRCAIESFIENGIEASTVTDIASKAKLTERSVFRYFETKQELVLAAVLQYWDGLKAQVSQETKDVLNDDKVDAVEKIRAVLLAYAGIFFTNRKELVFIEEAEVYLYRASKIGNLQEKELLATNAGKSPLADAIKKAVLDGAVVADKKLQIRYYNCFDGLLGLLQKSAILRDTTDEDQEFIKERLEEFCRLLADEFVR